MWNARIDGETSHRRFTLIVLVVQPAALKVL